eukprot:scpid89678/ scgid32490/ 
MAEYPGAEYKMSSYGSKHYTPGQKKEQWTQACEREEKVRKLHKATEKQADREADRHRQLQETGKLPTEKEMNVFNSDAKVNFTAQPCSYHGLNQCGIAGFKKLN